MTGDFENVDQVWLLATAWKSSICRFVLIYEHKPDCGTVDG
jgi:hypothetical protein